MKFSHIFRLFFFVYFFSISRRIMRRLNKNNKKNRWSTEWRISVVVRDSENQRQDNEGWATQEYDFLSHFIPLSTPISCYCSDWNWLNTSPLLDPVASESCWSTDRMVEGSYCPSLSAYRSFRLSSSHCAHRCVAAVSLRLHELQHCLDRARELA